MKYVNIFECPYRSQEYVVGKIIAPKGSYDLRLDDISTVKSGRCEITVRPLAQQILLHRS